MLEKYPGAARLFFSAIYYQRELMGVLPSYSPQERLLFLVDEAYQLGNCSVLSRIRDVGRGYGMAETLIFQSMGQCREIYGQDGLQSWLSSTYLCIWSGIADQGTAEDVSRLFGDRTVLVDSETSGHSGDSGVVVDGRRSQNTSIQTHEQKQSLISSRELIEVRRDEAFISMRGAKPIRCGRPIAFRRDDWKKCLNLPIDKNIDKQVETQKPEIPANDHLIVGNKFLNRGKYADEI